MSAIIALVITALGMFCYACDISDIAAEQRARDAKRKGRRR